MKQTVSIILCILSSLEIFAQPKDSTECEKLGDSNQYLWFNTLGDPFVDNGLRCFGLSSIVPEINPCTRIWVYEVDYPDSPVVHRIKLFEMGAWYRKKYANYYTLEWEGPIQETCKVKCIKKRTVEPLHGWSNLENEIKESGLDKIGSIPIPTYTDNATSGFLVLLQYVSDEKVINVDFSTYVYMGKSKYKRIRAFASLLRMIKQEFAVNLSLNKKGYDFLNTEHRKPVISIDKEVPLTPVKNSPKE